ncbi:MAG: WYL domain-containing protein [Anaerolineales bacterium]|nr:WYL domain-containing protein [Anaerolineales bacterium]
MAYLFDETRLNFFSAGTAGIHHLTPEKRGFLHRTGQGIADDLGISLRTLTRDIHILREQGLPIESDRGRGGGLRLDRRWGIGRMKLSYAEAVDLLISLAVAEQMGSPLFMDHLAQVRRKLVASFSTDTKSHVAGLKARILVAESASTMMLSTFTSPARKSVEQLHHGFLQLRQIKISYHTNNQTTKRVIEPHYLMLSSPIWYVLAWDHLRGEVRVFRCDRIERILMLDTGFKLRPVSDFQAAIEGARVI